MGRNDEPAGLYLGQYQIHRRHPAGRHHRAGAAFELGERIGQLVAGRIGGATVGVAALALETVKQIGRR